MIELQGKYNKTKIFTNNIEQEAINQIQEILNQEFTKDSVIRIMPDTHAGAGCVIGTTMTIIDKAVPNLVGFDIGCGMNTIELDEIDLDLPKIDEYIKNNIPSGFNTNKHSQFNFEEEINNIKCKRDIPKASSEFNKAIGTLGGGNHFIEINKHDNEKYLVIHSGSRNLGLQVAKYYQQKAFEYHSGLNEEYENARINIINEYKQQNKKSEIQDALIKLKKQFLHESKIDKDICYLEGNLMYDYLHDMKIVQKYAEKNRDVIGRRIVEECLQLSYDKLNKFQTIHNYIDTDNMMLRKGAISAKKEEIVLIPINMRDGSLICKGKGNPDWNYSAPHGAGRLMSRTKAKNTLILDDFKKSMEGIYTTSLSLQTLDEAPMVYKPIDEIINNIQDTVEIIKIIKPIYNFKAKE